MEEMIKVRPNAVEIESLKTHLICGIVSSKEAYYSFHHGKY